MVKLLFATRNTHKINEIRRMLSSGFDILGLDDINCKEELPETRETIEGNAEQKAEYVYENFDLSCFADDTGLEVNALNGAPGVYSARYAGSPANSEANMDKLLQELEICRRSICTIQDRHMPYSGW